MSYFTCFLAVFLTMIMGDVKTIHAQTTQNDSAFTVKGVKIDVTANSAKEARDKAFRQAQEESLPILMEQLKDAGYDTYALTQIDDKIIANAIKDFEISNEKISAIRYKGEFVFRYDDQILNQYFYTSGYTPQGEYAQNPYNPAQPLSKNVNKDRVLVLPFFDMGNGKTMLWEGENPWKTVWVQKATKSIFAPIGDLSDIRDISDTQALTYDPEKLARMATRYSADRVVVLIGTHEGAPLPSSAAQPTKGTFRVSVYDTARGRPEFLNDFVLNGQDYNVLGDALSVAYNRSVEMIYGLQPTRAIGNDNYQEYSPETLAQVSQYEPEISVGPKSSFQARIEYTSMQEWIKAQQALRSMPGILDMNVLSLTPQQAEIKVSYQGAFDELATAMTRVGYNIQPTSKIGRYVIYSSRRSAYNQNGGIVFR